MLLFLLVATALGWMHFAILRMEKKRVPALAGPRDLPELEVLGKPTPIPAAHETSKRPLGVPQPAHS
jgi:NNP family nitrate/nitrite transporter-like MFS transporter